MKGGLRPDSPATIARQGLAVLAHNAERRIQPQPTHPVDAFLRALELGYGDGDNGWLR